MKTKNIVGIIILTVFTLLAGLIVVSAVVPKNFTMPLAQPQSITIYGKSGSTGNLVIEKNDERFDKIVELFQTSSNAKLIEAFFQGKAFNSTKLVKDYKSLTTSVLVSTDTCLYIEFNYGTDQEVNLLNSGLSLTSTEKTYKSVVLEVKDTTTLSMVNAYIRYGTTSTSGSQYRYVSYSRQAQLFEYVSEILSNQ